MQSGSMPAYATNAIMGQGQNPFGSTQGMSGLAQLLGGLFGHSGAPYDAAMDQYKNFMHQGQEAQNPFFNAGTGAIPQYQDWLKNMSNPSGFINTLMGQYQESPYAKYQQQQSIRSGTNAASASGLTGSTPFAQQLQQNASNISSQDMNQWLQNALGINTQYGAGLNSLISGGQNSANALTNLYNDYGSKMGEAAYGKKAGENQDFWNTAGGGLSLITHGLFG